MEANSRCGARKEKVERFSGGNRGERKADDIDQTLTGNCQLTVLLCFLRSRTECHQFGRLTVRLEAAQHMHPPSAPCVAAREDEDLMDSVELDGGKGVDGGGLETGEKLLT